MSARAMETRSGCSVPLLRIVLCCRGQISKSRYKKRAASLRRACLRHITPHSPDTLNCEIAHKLLVGCRAQGVVVSGHGV